MPAAKTILDKRTPRVRLTLTTRCGRTGEQWLGDALHMVWDDDDGDDETVLAKFDLEVGGAIKESFAITGDAWRALESEGDLDEFVRDARSCGIESALRAQLDLYENHYEHEECGTTWTDQHSCGCDDKCPTCGAAISAHDSIQLSGLDDESPAGYSNLLATSAVPAEAPPPLIRPRTRGA